MSLRYYVEFVAFAALGALLGVVIEMVFYLVAPYLHGWARVLLQLIVNAFVISTIEKWLGEEHAKTLYDKPAGSFFFILLLAFQPNFYVPLITALLGHLRYE